jgi:superfamily II DNA or RNA helicase
MDILQKFESIKTFRENGVTSVHKPVMLLIALRHCYKQHNRMTLFSTLDNEFKNFFLQFYLEGKYENSYSPFGKLENDGIWEVENSTNLQRTIAGHLHKKELLEKNVSGGFSEEIYTILKSDKELILSIVNHLLTKYFPHHQHSQLLLALDLPLENVKTHSNSVADVKSIYKDKKIMDAINKSFKGVSWGTVYRAGDQNLFQDFYKPALKLAVSYDRAVGFFSSQSLVSNLQGISGLIKNEGRMRLVIGHPLDDDEFAAVKQGYRLSELLEDLDARLREMLEQDDEGLSLNLTLLSMLIASKRLEIKFAFRKRGMYHEKIGILSDCEGNRLVFQGSANETIYALDEGFNAESIMVFKSWQEEIFKAYGAPCVDGFEKLWNGEQPNTVTVNVPSKIYETIVEKANKISEPKRLFDEIDTIYSKSLNEFFDEKLSFNYPKVPKFLNGRDFIILDHQKAAIRAWIGNNYKGILKLSTGSGKTITSIFAATKVFEARKAKNAVTVLIVAVPYQELARQWVDNLKIFNIHPLRCWYSREKWEDDLKKELLDLKMKAISFVSIVVVNRTLESSTFRDLISTIPEDNVMMIGDECHNHGAKKTNSALPNAFYRMGLSATPYRSDDDEIDNHFPNEAKERINSYYGNIVAEYSLGDAIHDGVLCEYNYHIVPVYLTAEEEEQYEKLSAEIGQLIAFGVENLSLSKRNQLTMLCGKRSRLLGAASNKLSALDALVRTIPTNERSHSLFYCGEGKVFDETNSNETDLKVIKAVSRVLSDAGWRTSRFTSEEKPADRKKIMANFVQAHIDGLVSMKVLDEGVDVPVCAKAFILASTRNPRQYVQRRGRVLRKAEGKEFAEIYDFVILPVGSSFSLDALRSAELERIDDFVLLANNRFQVEKEVDRLNLRK